MITMSTMIPLMSGMLVAGYLVAALFFLKFWRATRDALFARFSAAFALLAVQRAALYTASVSGSDTTWLYTLRLAAFVLILWAIVAKNRDAGRDRPVA